MKAAGIAAKYIREQFSSPIDHAIVSGSGLKIFEDKETVFSIPYSQIPHFPLPTVEGHEGRLDIYSIGEKNIALFKGRVHYYEGYSPWDITFSIRLMYYLGIKDITLTNAAGSVVREIEPGDIVILNDYINFAQINPLIGHNINFGERFTPMNEPFAPKLLSHAVKTLKNLNMVYKTGIYVFLTGPAYESRAEVAMVQKFGGSLVGMSTVPEIILAKRLGLNILGISICTNFGTGISDKTLHHEEVIEIGEKVKKNLNKFFETLFSNDTI
ncbi:purine-nucleoside phosphorylase [bacterium]|nr:purine-nucleoside phosphorylase [bacterium]